MKEDFEQLIRLAAKKGASDIHLVAGVAPVIRLDGELQSVKHAPLTAVWTESVAKGVLSKVQMASLQAYGDVDAGIEAGGASMRVNVHRNSTGYALSMRLIPVRIPTAQEIGLLEIMLEACHQTDGLILISGPSGSGKSTTLAAMVEIINTHSARHILTLEDPIEYRFSNKKSLIEQRQLGNDFASFSTGLGHILRQDPNVIVVGEMRDPETIELALTAAETGHLVLSTLHAPNATEVVERIVNVFEGAKQQQILIQLSATLRLVAAQRLLPSKDGGLVAAREILTASSAVRNAIRHNNLSSIRSAIQTGRKFGMQSMESAIEGLIEQGLIDKQTYA